VSKVDIKKALELLKQYLSEIERLKPLEYNNNEWPLWKDKVKVVVESAFGDNSDEYNHVNPQPWFSPYRTRKERQEDYLRLLNEYELGITKILQKYEIIGITSSYKVKNNKSEVERPKAFIAHGGESARLRKVCEFLAALGVEPVVVERSASEGRSTEENVEKRMEDSDCAINFAEYGSIQDVKTGVKHPRLNVIDELGRARQKHPNRTILLLEKGVVLPSNESGIIYEHFTKRNMEKAFIKVARELKAFGIIKAVKPQ